MHPNPDYRGNGGDRKRWNHPAENLSMGKKLCCSGGPKTYFACNVPQRKRREGR